VISIGDGVFKSCTSLTDVTFNGNAPSLYGIYSSVYPFSNNPSNLTVWHYAAATGFTSPTWQGVNTSIIVPTTLPILNLENFYESDSGESITVDATPTYVYPIIYTYQWYFNEFSIPSTFGGTNSSYAIDGLSSNEGTWRVSVTNDAGMASAEFEYRVFNDADSDGLSDYRESDILGTNPNLADTDSDGLNDYSEVNTHSTDPLLSDSDSDGLSDADEVNNYSSDPLDSDSDDDSLLDGAEVNTYSTDPNDTDSDDDQLTDADEVNTHQTNPNLSDSDSDGLNDYKELVTYSTDPLQSDSDSDGISDGDEVNTYSTNPLLEDTSGDGFTDGFLVSEGFSPTTDYSALRTETVDITEALNESRLLGQQDVTGDPGSYELFSKSQVMDLRPESKVIEVINNEVTIDLEMHQSNDLQTWSKVGESISMTVPADTNTKFFRHAFSNSDSTDETTVEFTFIGTNNHDFGNYYGNEAIISTANIPLYPTGSDNYYVSSYQVIEWSSNTPIGGSQFGRPTVTVATTSSLVGHNLKIRFFKYNSNDANNFSSSGPIITIDGDALAQQEQTVEAASGIGVSSQLGFSVRVWKEAKP
jgi:hypothetical protein